MRTFTVDHGTDGGNPTESGRQQRKGTVMAIRVYLKRGTKIEEMPEYNKTHRKNNDGQKWDVHTFDEMNLQKEGGRWYLSTGSDHWENKDLPPVLIEHIEEVSNFWHLPSWMKRESGIYRHESAEMELQGGNASGKAKNLEDLNVLLRNIKTGEIRPEISYEVAQTGMSGAELQNTLDDCQHKLELKERELLEVLNKVQALEMAMTQKQSVKETLAVILKKIANFVSWPFRALRKKLGR